VPDIILLIEKKENTSIEIFRDKLTPIIVSTYTIIVNIY